jgi:BA14K-like protein
LDVAKLIANTFGDFVMSIQSRLFAAAFMAAAGALAAPASAAPISPISSSLELQNASAPLVETVQYRRGWNGGYRGGYYRGGGFRGAGLGIAAGAVLGGAILGATQPYGYYRYGGYDPGYNGYDSAYGYAAPYAGGSQVDYCQQRFRSYDPGSGTYLGFDGLRHPCP